MFTYLNNINCNDFKLNLCIPRCNYNIHYVRYNWNSQFHDKWLCTALRRFGTCKWWQLWLSFTLNCVIKCLMTAVIVFKIVSTVHDNMAFRYNCFLDYNNCLFVALDKWEKCGYGFCGQYRRIWSLRVDQLAFKKNFENEVTWRLVFKIAKICTGWYCLQIMKMKRAGC